MNYTDLTKVSLKFKSLSDKTIVIIINYLLFVVIMRLTPTQSLCIPKTRAFICC